MSGKVHVVFFTILVLCVVGCARDRGKEIKSNDAIIAATSTSTTKTQNANARSTPPPTQRPQASNIRPSAASVSRPALAPPTNHADLTDLLNGNAEWMSPGKTLFVTRSVQKPVPLFRQAIVLASTRAALAGSRLSPRAEFRHGLLTLHFSGGTNQQLAADINRVLAIREVTKLEVNLR